MPLNLLLKDKLFHAGNVAELSKLIQHVYPKFNIHIFQKDVLAKFPELELKERYFWIRENLVKNIPEDFETTVQIFLDAVKNEPEDNRFIFASLLNYIAVHGCREDRLDVSLSAMGELTKYFSAEFAIRSFITNFPTQTLQQVIQLAQSKNTHQRRLASEGMRPKLPWAMGITFDYKQGAEVLDLLFYDTERYVTRSVANHLNDISKIDPDFVLEKLESWKNSGKQNTKEMQYIINHSLRTSIKKGHTNTFTFLGYDSNPQVSIKNIKVANNSITIGQAIELSFDIHASKTEKVIIDYKIIYPTPLKKRSEKVFKLKNIVLKPGEKISIQKKQSFKIMTTKKLYSGKYHGEILVNGKGFGEFEFYLEV
ncbi:DNA alkylation repair protein [Candidatus Peregrinibacteria bacterium]|nr:MAG: DNA alkylation repair protein [Candidatus Peregrinibacteria bacterium]